MSSLSLSLFFFFFSFFFFFLLGTCLDDGDHWCSLLFSSPGCLAVHGAGNILTLIFGLVAGVLVSRNPRVAVLQGLVLRGEVDPLTSPGGVVAVALRESTGTGGQV